MRKSASSAELSQDSNNIKTAATFSRKLKQTNKICANNSKVELLYYNRQQQHQHQHHQLNSGCDTGYAAANHEHIYNQNDSQTIVNSTSPAPNQTNRRQQTKRDPNRYETKTLLSRATSYADLNQQTSELITQTVRPLKEAASIWRSSSALASSQLVSRQQQNYATSNQSTMSSAKSRSMHQLAIDMSTRNTLGNNNKHQQRHQNDTSEEDEMSSSSRQGPDDNVINNRRTVTNRLRHLQQQQQQQLSSRTNRRPSTTSRSLNRQHIDSDSSRRLQYQSQQQQASKHQYYDNHDQYFREQQTRSGTLRSTASEFNLNINSSHSSQSNSPPQNYHHHQLPTCSKIDLSLLPPANAPLSNELVQHVVDELQALSRYATRLHSRLQSSGRQYFSLRAQLARGLQNSIDILCAAPPKQHQQQQHQHRQVEYQRNSFLSSPTPSIAISTTNPAETNNDSPLTKHESANNSAEQSRRKLFGNNTGRSARRLSGTCSVFDVPISSASTMSTSARRHLLYQSPAMSTMTATSNRATSIGSTTGSSSSGSCVTTTNSCKELEEEKRHNRLSTNYRTSSPDEGDTSCSSANNTRRDRSTVASDTATETTGAHKWNIDQVLEAYSDRLVKIVQQRIADNNQGAVETTTASALLNQKQTNFGNQANDDNNEVIDHCNTNNCNQQQDDVDKNDNCNNDDKNFKLS